MIEKILKGLFMAVAAIAVLFIWLALDAYNVVIINPWQIF